MLFSSAAAAIHLSFLSLCNYCLFLSFLLQKSLGTAMSLKKLPTSAPAPSPKSIGPNPGAPVYPFRPLHFRIRVPYCESDLVNFWPAWTEFNQITSLQSLKAFYICWFNCSCWKETPTRDWVVKTASSPISGIMNFLDLFTGEAWSREISTHHCCQHFQARYAELW